MKRKWRIKKDLVVGEVYGENVLNTIMKRYVGDTFECTEDEFDGTGYSYRGWNWTREMVEPVEPEFKFGDMLKINGGATFAYLGRTAHGKIITMTNANEPAKEFGEVDLIAY